MLINKITRGLKNQFPQAQGGNSREAIAGKVNETVPT
jgi:hypothetical protein